MTGYYKNIHCDSIYHVYQNGFDLLAHCISSSVRTSNKPFPIAADKLQRYLRWNCWMKIEKPEL